MANEHALEAWRNAQTPKLSQGDLAEKVGVTRWMINRIELRERSPSLTLATKIRDFTGGAVTLDDLARSPEDAR